jgi:hypothetical protein
MTTVRADEVRPGDVITVNCQAHEISHVHRRAGWAWPIASDDTGWAMALSQTLVDVVRHPT